MIVRFQMHLRLIEYILEFISKLGLSIQALLTWLEKHQYAAKWDKTLSIRWILYTNESRKYTQMQQNKQLKAKWFFTISPFENKNDEKLFLIPKFPIKCTSSIPFTSKENSFIFQCKWRCNSRLQWCYLTSHIDAKN